MRTVFASIPVLIGFVTTITGQLQDIVDADIFLVSALAGVAEFVAQIVGDILVGTTLRYLRGRHPDRFRGDPTVGSAAAAANFRCVLPPVPPAAVLV